MYNEPLKNAFLEYRNKSKATEDNERTILNSVAKYEELWGADICTRNKDDAQMVIDGIARLRVETQAKQLRVLQEYVRWCINRCVPGACDGMLNVKRAGLDRMRTQMVSSPEDLQRCLDDVFPPESLEDVTNTYRCYYWLAFAGVDEKCAFELTRQNIDFEHRLIRIGMEEYPLYDQAVHAFRNAVTLTDFHTSDERVRSSRKPRSDGKCIMRGSRGVPKVTTFRSMMAKHFKKDGVRDLSYKRVKLSGLFYETMMAEKCGLEPDFKAVAAKTVILKPGESFESKEVRARINDTATDLMSNYRRWKTAF